jgi:hypothetical protein
MPSTKSIAAQLSNAFTVAIFYFEEWTGGPEPEISYELSPTSIAAVCESVAACSGRAPNVTYGMVSKIAEDFQGTVEAIDRDCRIPEDHSYKSVAMCLLRLYNARVDYRAKLKRRSAVSFRSRASLDLFGSPGELMQNPHRPLTGQHLANEVRRQTRHDLRVQLEYLIEYCVTHCRCGTQPSFGHCFRGNDDEVR